MNKLTIVKILSLLVAAAGVLVMIGWIFDIGFLKSIYPTWVTMKFTTALSFLLSGLILYLITKTREGGIRAIEILPLVSIIIFLLMATLLVSSIFNIRTGIEDLFVKEASGALKTVTPGRPSIPTMIAFVFIAIAGFLGTVDQRKFQKIFFLLGGAIAVIGIVAIVGYILQIPLFYYYVPGINTAIAIHTAILFIIIGVSLVLLGKGEFKEASAEGSKKVFKTTIKSRLTFTFLTIGLVSALFLGFISISSSGNAVREEVANKLLLFAEANEGQIYAYFDSIESRTIDFSSDGFIRDSLKEIVRTGSLKTAKDLNEHLVKNKQSLDPTLAGILILDLKGKVVASTDEKEMGRDESDNEYFSGGQEEVFVIDESKDHKHFGLEKLIIAAAPLTDKETGQLLGVLVNVFKTDKLETVLSGQLPKEEGVISSRLAQTGTLEVYLVSKEKEIFVHSRSTEKIKADTLPVRKCLENKEEINTIYPNYAQKQVIGASLCFPGRGWTLVAEITTQEVYAPLRSMQFGLAVFTIIILLFVIIDAFIVANRISQPIKVLHEGTEVVGKGNLDWRVEVKTGDEIEQLATSFNQMAAKLKEEQAKLTASIKSLSLGFIMADNDNNIIMTNSAIEKILGRGNVSLDWINTQFAGKFNLLENCRKCREEKKTIDVKDVEYGSKFLRVFLAPVVIIRDHEEVIGTVILMEDISEAKTLERSKDEFFSIASHELRTPLTAIQGNTSLIQQFYGEKLKKDKDLWEMIEDIRESSVRLISIVKDFLDVSRLELGKIQFKNESFDLAALMQDVVKEYQTTAAAKNLYLRREELKVKTPLVFADKERTKQVLINLIGNGIKFTDKGGVSLQIRPSGQFVRILVSDTGRGISKDGQKLLFRKFQQAEKNIYTRDVVGGTGLGLYISKLIVEGMGGKIGLEKTEVGKGSTFVVELPILAKKS